ncbi:hypothetical protein HMPREF3034_02395 [Prevotella sp. DNF00663]|uniref:hypothetical protein n=1 Tax=Prevotella sp. DNF00663 TaxID=1384078 RepID=UPI000783B138|nr:hypothetical protein [Prevotella sp. DNF00663]KXB78592.1 hypothetical protein HMPREF3034_02395 [Prevotella sp. DNF00663]
MPYRRLPKTDTARLKALKTLLDCNDIYTVRNRFVDWKTINDSQTMYELLLTANSQYQLCFQAQTRQTAKVDKVQRKAFMYLSHFVQVLLMSVERGEIKRQRLLLYGLSVDTSSLPDMKTGDNLITWGSKVIEGEKARIKAGGRPIYNPTIGMVATHYDIYRDVYERQQQAQARTQEARERLKELRPKVDEVLLDLWNQIEKHYENEPPEVRYVACRKLGVVYYYRRHEEHLY